MLAILLTSLLPWQDPAPAPTPEPAPAQAAESPAPRVLVTPDDKTAKQMATELQKALRGSGSMADKSRALDAVADSSHAQLLKPLAEAVEKDKSVVIRKRAASLLRNQPKEDATDTIRKLMRSPRVQGNGGVLAELVHGLSHCGYRLKFWKDLEDLFERDYAAERVPVQEALLDLITAHKEKQAVDLLLRNLDEPAPANVDDPSNPPQEYWEARWKAWAVWKNKVKEALFAITGQRFSTAAEARAWLAKNPLR